VKLSFVGKGRRIVWDLPIFNTSEAKEVMDWARSNRTNAAAIAGFIQIVLLEARSAQK
jgi:hypothetical protein